MAVNIGPKIGIDGEAEYRKEIQNIIQQTKTLSSEMNETAAAFKNEADKEKASAEIAKKLNQQISTQRQLVAKLEDAVQKSAATTGENSTQTLKWKEQLAKAKTELHGMEQQTDRATSEVAEFGAAQEEAGNKSSIFGQMLKANLASDLIKKGLQATAAIVRDLAKGMIDAVKNTAAYADEINTLAKTTGMGTDAIQEWKYAADLIDVSFETIEGSLTKLTKNMDAARDGSAKQTAAFETLGVAVTDANGNLRDSNDVFMDVIDALRKIENPTERDAIAMDILGKSAKDLNPLIETSRSDLEALRAEARKVGAVMDSSTLNKLNKVQDGFDRLGGAWDGIKKKLGAKVGIAILPELEKLVDTTQYLANTGNISGFVDRLIRQLTDKRDWTKAGEQLGDVLGTILAKTPKIVVAGVKLALGLLKGFVQGLPKFGEAIIEEFQNISLSDATIDMRNDLRDLRDEMDQIPGEAQRMRDSLSEVNAKQKEAEHWVEIFDELSKKTEPTAEETERLKDAVSRLNDLYPDLGLQIDNETGKWNLNTTEIRNNIEAMSDKYRAQAYYAAASETLTDLAKIEAETEQLRDQLQLVQSRLETEKKFAAVKQDSLDKQNDLNELWANGWMSLEDYYAKLTEMSGQQISSAEDVQKYYNDTEQALKNALKTIDELTVQEGELSKTVEEGDKKIQALNKDVEYLYSRGDEYTAAVEETTNRTIQTVDTSMNEIMQTIEGGRNQAKKSGEIVGRAITSGTQVGMAAGQGALVATAGSIVSAAIAKMKATAEIHSPSKKTRDLIGKNLALGVVEGYDDVMKTVQTRGIFSLTPVFDEMTAGGTVTNNTSTTNVGGVSVNVYARDGESANEIADRVMRKIQSATNQRKAVFA